VGRGDYLFHHNAPISTFYLVHKGSIKTERVTPDGQLIVTGFHFAGDLVALESIAATRHATDAIALENSEVCEFDKQSMMALCAQETTVSTWLIQQLGMRLKDKDAASCWATRMKRSDRVLRFFVELHDRLHADSHAPSGRAPKPMTKHDIAMYLHMSPETLSRTIGELRKAGWLQVMASEFILTDVESTRRKTRL
jgi:CRP/FNR family transcriptional regulator